MLDEVEFAGHGSVPKLNQTLWPDHCVQGTAGAELHKDLKVRLPTEFRSHRGSMSIVVQSNGLTPAYIIPEREVCVLASQVEYRGLSNGCLDGGGRPRPARAR